jgi:hypothetical protein
VIADQSGASLLAIISRKRCKEFSLIFEETVLPSIALFSEDLYFYPDLQFIIGNQT